MILKKAKQMSILAACFGLGVILSGCDSGGTSNSTGSTSTTDPTLIDGGQTSANFQLMLQSSQSTTQLKSALVLSAATSSDVTAGSSGISLQSASINIRKIRLKLPEGVTCNDFDFSNVSSVSCETEAKDGDANPESKIVVMGPIVYNLIAGTATPSLSSLQLPSGVYTEVELKIDDADSADGVVSLTDSLANHSLVASGTFMDSEGMEHPFSLALNFDEEIKITNGTGFEVKEQTINDILIHLNADQWFANLDLQKCVDQGDLSLAGDSLELEQKNVSDTDGQGDCKDIEDTIKNNIKSSMNVKEQDD